MQTKTIAVDETPREVQRAPFASESGPHDFVEQHAEALLGVKIVASSRPRGNGLFKIDILAEDGDRRPWIIECKHDLVDAAAWSQLRRYRDALKEGWAEAAPRFGGGASREPVLVAIGYRFDRSVDADEVVRLAYRYHDVKLGADEVQTQTVGRVSLHPILGAADESAQRHPKVSKKNATVERLQRFAPVERLWRRAGLKVPQQQPNRGRRWLADGSCIRRRPAYRHHVWAYDFVADRTQDGRPHQVLGGVDYAMSDAVSLGIKGRWVRFGRFAADDIEWERLRSHASELRLDGSEPVTFRIRTDGALSFVGVSLAMRYTF